MKRKWMTLAAFLLWSVVLAGCSGKEAPQAAAPVPTVPTLMDTENVLLEEQVIYDTQGIRITVKGMEENTATGTEIRVLVENGTQHNIALSGDLFVVNGVTVPGYLYTQAAAGTKSNDTIELYADVLRSSGILTIGTLRGYDTRIVDTDTYETLAQIPLELETAHGRDQGYSPDETGVELYQQEGVTVIAQVITQEFYGKTARLLVKNGTGKDIIVEAENISVNGYTVDAWLYDTVCRDTVRYCQLDLFESGLAENGIDQIETVTFRLNILDAQSYETIAQSQQLTVTVEG